MTIASILERLSGTRRSGSGWIAKCPAHDDRSPSLSLREGLGGRVLVFCHAGCSPERITAAMGLTMADLFQKPRGLRSREPSALRVARRIAQENLCHMPRSVREEPVTIIFCDEENLDAAIARGLALAVEGELCQIALKGNPDESPTC